MTALQSQNHADFFKVKKGRVDIFEDSLSIVYTNFQSFFLDFFN